MVQPNKCDSPFQQAATTSHHHEPPPPPNKKAVPRWSRASTVSLSSVEVDSSELEVYVPFRPTSRSIVSNSQAFFKQEGPTQHHKSDPIPERQSVLKAKAEANRVIASTPQSGTLAAMQQLATKEKTRRTMVALPKSLSPATAQDNDDEDEDDGFLPRKRNHDLEGNNDSHKRHTNSTPNAQNGFSGNGGDELRAWQSQGVQRAQRETPVHFGRTQQYTPGFVRQDTDDSDFSFPRLSTSQTPFSHPFDSNDSPSSELPDATEWDNNHMHKTNVHQNNQPPQYRQNRRLVPPFDDIGLGGGPGGTHKHKPRDRAVSTSMQMMTIAEHVLVKQTHNRDGGTRRSPPPIAHHRPQVTDGFQAPTTNTPNSNSSAEYTNNSRNRTAPHTVVQQRQQQKDSSESNSQTLRAKHSRSGTLSALRELVKRPQLVDPLDVAIIRAQPLFNNPRIVDKNGFSIRCDFGWEERGLCTVGDIVNERGEVDWDRITQVFDTNVLPLVREQTRFVVKAIPHNWLQMLRSHGRASAALASKS